MLPAVILSYTIELSSVNKFSKPKFRPKKRGVFGQLSHKKTVRYKVDYTYLRYWFSIIKKAPPTGGAFSNLLPTRRASLLIELVGSTYIYN